jgi:hypothetical protein
MTGDAENDTVATRQVRKAGREAAAAAQFRKGALDYVGGAHFFPVSLDGLKEVQGRIGAASYTGRAPLARGSVFSSSPLNRARRP